MHYQLTFFVPDTALDEVKAAVFSTGAGAQGDYTECCFQVKGFGQFKPLAGANPHIGEHNILETVEEWRVEVLCDQSTVKAAVNALIAVHPYEEVAFSVTQLVDVDLL